MSDMENKLRWHLLDCSKSPLPEAMKPAEGFRAGIGQWRSDIYIYKSGAICAFYHDGQGYSRARNFDTIFDALRWAQEQYLKYLEPTHGEDDVDSYR